MLISGGIVAILISSIVTFSFVINMIAFITRKKKNNNKNPTCDIKTPDLLGFVSESINESVL